MILRQLTSIRCQLVSIQGGVLFGLEERQVAGNPKQKADLPHGTARKQGTYAHGGGAERGHHGLIDKRNDAFETFLVELVGKLLLIFMIYRVRTRNKIATREPEECQSCP